MRSCLRAFRPLVSLSIAAVLVLPLGLAPAPALAHPHVWIEAQAVVRFAGGRVTEVEQTWRFDPLFSSLLIGDFDKNQDAALDDAEQRALQEGAFANLQGFGYFTQFTAGSGADAVMEKAQAFRDFTAYIHDGTLVYRFTTPLPKPVDPRRTPLTIGIYDESYYVDVQMLRKDAVALVGSEAGGCAFTYGEGAPIYLGTVYPTTIEVRCGGR